MKVELLCTVKINGEFRYPTEGTIELPDGVGFNPQCMVEVVEAVEPVEAPEEVARTEVEKSQKTKGKDA